jgi:hypothetical protein
MNEIKNTSQRKYALIAGFSLLAMTIAAIFANFFVFESLVVQKDAMTTANNISADSGKFLLGLFAFGFVIILDFVVAWALYIFFKPVYQKISFITAGLRIIYGIIFAIALFSLTNILFLLKETTDSVINFELANQIMASVNEFSNIWNFGFLFFGLHLVLLGYIVFKSKFFKSKFIRMILAILLVIAGLGYILDTLGAFFIANYSMEIAMFTFIGEVLFMFWLLINGGKVKSSL